MTFFQEGEASWLTFNRQFVALLCFPASLVSQRLQEKIGRKKMVLRVVEVISVRSEPPVGVDVRTFSCERHGFGAFVYQSIISACRESWMFDYFAEAGRTVQGVHGPGRR